MAVRYGIAHEVEIIPYVSENYSLIQTTTRINPFNILRIDGGFGGGGSAMTNGLGSGGGGGYSVEVQEKIKVVVVVEEVPTTMV